MKTVLDAFRNNEWTKTGGVQEYEQSAGKSEFKAMWIIRRTELGMVKQWSICS